MIFYYNQFNLAEPSKMYLARPCHKIIKPLTGVVSARLTTYLNKVWEIRFEIDSEINGKKNPIFDKLNQYMEIKIDNLGWFRIDETPEESYEDGRTYKIFTASGYETVLRDLDVSLLSINCGTEESVEMYKENVNELGIPKRNIQLYIKNESDDPSSSSYWKLGLLNILQHEYFNRKGWKIGEIDIEIASLRGRQFSIDSKTAYAFLTQDVASAYKCMFQFDRINKTINAYPIKNIGKSLNIELSLRNVINSIDITGQNDKIYNSFRVYGADEEQVLFEYINFGSNKITNYNYFIESGMIPSETAEKYIAYNNYRESKRTEYADLSLKTMQLNEEISVLENQTPVDEVEIIYDNLSLEELNVELESAKNILALLEEMHTVNGVLKIKGTSDYAMYISFKNVIIPKIQNEIASRNQSTVEPAEIDWETDWELYGINELEAKKTTYTRQIEVLTEKNYNKPWSSSIGGNEEFHNKQHKLYLEYKNYVSEITTRLNALYKRKAEIQTELNNVSKQRTELVNTVSINNSTWGFTEEELSLFNALTYESDFKDSTIEVLDTDTLEDIIDLAWDLLDSANEELEIESRPQMSFKIGLDNIYHIKEYIKKANNIEMGDFIYLELLNGFKTKQRLIKMELELVNFNDTDLSFEFSDMVTVYGNADDYRYLLEDTDNHSSKNSITKNSSNNAYISSIASTVAMQVFQKYLTGSNTSIFPNGISDDDLQKLVDALSGIIDGNLSLEELKVKMAEIDSLEADSAFIKYLNNNYLVSNQADFGELEAVVGAIDTLLNGTISSELGHIIKLTAETVDIDEAVIREMIAAQITVSMLKAGDISTDTFHIVSDDGGVEIIGNTMQFKDANGTIRIQIGRDANDDFTFCLYDEIGTGVLIDSTGIKESAITDGLIKTDMISDKAVTGDKIDKTGMREWVDDDGNRIFDISTLYYGDDKFEVSYDQVKKSIVNLGDEIQKINPYNVILSTEYQTIPCTNGLVKDDLVIKILFSGYKGSTQYETNIAVGELPSGMTVTSIISSTSTQAGELSISISKDADLGGINIVTGSINLSFTIEETTIVKTFGWTKVNDGIQGAQGASLSYNLELSSQVIKKDDTGVHPSSITLSAFSIDDGITNPYSGRFVIEESSDGVTYSSTYSSESDESSISYSLINNNIGYIRCSLYASGSLTNKLDVKTVIIIADADYLQSQITENKTSLAELSVVVDNNTQTIEQKASKSDITEEINKYDGTTIKVIRDQVVDNKLSIDGVTQEISNVKTTVEQKADGSTVKTLQNDVATLEQSANEFKQTVESNYLTETETKELVSNSSTSIIDQVGDMISFSVENNITGEGSYVNQKADEITNVIGNDLFKNVNVRYIRDWVFSNDVDNENRFTECRVIDSDENNVAKGIQATAYTSDLLEVTSIENLSIYTDDIVDDSYIYDADCSMLQLDLGQVYENIEEIYTYHYYADSRKNNTKLEISEDGEHWITIYDSTINGYYEETNNGHIEIIQNQSISDQISFLRQSINEFNILIKQGGDFAEIKAKVDGILQRVSSNEGNIEKLGEQVLSAEEWKVVLSTHGMYEDEENLIPDSTMIRFTPLGLSVSSSTTEGRTTEINSTSFKGYYNDGVTSYDDDRGEVVFSLDEDLLTTQRIKANRGADFITMKLLPVNFSGHKCLAFIKGGGDA